MSAQASIIRIIRAMLGDTIMNDIRSSDAQNLTLSFWSGCGAERAEVIVTELRDNLRAGAILKIHREGRVLRLFLAEGC